MASVTLVRHFLRPDEKELFEVPAGTVVGAWAFEQGLRGNLSIWINGDKAASDAVLGEEDHLAVVVMPADPVTAFLAAYIGQTAAAIVTSALISVAVNAVIGALFKPKRPGATPSPSPVYSIGGGQNSARLGEPIPVIYGEILAVPDYAAQPYVEYGVTDASGARTDSNDQWLNAILCLGQGEYDVLDVTVGNSSTKLLDNGVVTYTVFPPQSHSYRMGNIRKATGVWENVYTLPEVADQELLAPNEATQASSTYYWQATNIRTGQPSPTATDISSLTSNNAALVGTVIPNVTVGWEENRDWISDTIYWQGYTVADYVAVASSSTTVGHPDVMPKGQAVPGATGRNWIGPFESCLASQTGDRLDVDLIFPGGLNKYDGSNLQSLTVEVEVEATPIDANDAPTGAAILQRWTFTGATNTPQRFTRTLRVPQGRYKVRMSRVTNKSTNLSENDRVVWGGLKFFLTETPATQRIYGHTTLMVVRMKATNGIGGNATSQIGVRLKRKLPILGQGALVATTNPVDAFVDIMMAPYGGNRPRNDSEMDLTHLAALHTQWAGTNGFNGSFDQNTTVYEALQSVLQVVSAGPLPIGSRMLVMEDKVKPLRSMMFSEGNIVAETLEIGYSWAKVGEPSGVRVEFRDRDTFKPDFVIEPPDSLDYQSMTLFGCTSKQTATEYARGVVDKRALQRRTVTFETELEGLLLLPGERFALSHTMPRWGTMAFVANVNGNALELDRPLPWKAGQQHVVVLRGPDGMPSPQILVTQGADTGIVVLASMPSFPIVQLGSSREPTHVVFGVKDTEVTDWICTSIAPSGDVRVKIEGQIYAPSAYARAQPHQRT